MSDDLTVALFGVVTITDNLTLPGEVRYRCAFLTRTHKLFNMSGS